MFCPTQVESCSQSKAKSVEQNSPKEPIFAVLRRDTCLAQVAFARPEARKKTTDTDQSIVIKVSLSGFRFFF